MFKQWTFFAVHTVTKHSYYNKMLLCNAETDVQSESVKKVMMETLKVLNENDSLNRYRKTL